MNKKLLTQVVHLLLPTGSTLLGTDLSSLTNGIWEIHAECYCILPLSATFGQNWIDLKFQESNVKDQNLAGVSRVVNNNWTAVLY